MEKKRFEFCQEVKIVTWKRQYFMIEAENEEEATEMAKEFAEVDIAYDSSVEVEEVEYLSEHEQVVSLAENDGCETIEVYRGRGLMKEKITDNLQTYIYNADDYD